MNEVTLPLFRHDLIASFAGGLARKERVFASSLCVLKSARYRHIVWFCVGCAGLGPGVRQVKNLTLGLAETGVAALFDEATGYQDDRARNALENILATFPAKERQKVDPAVSSLFLQGNLPP
jgi:hypothetical protein